MRKFSLPAILFLGYAVLLLFTSGCSSKPDNWSLDLPSIGASSSPAATDLNGDGILDIVIGGGAKEFTTTEKGVIAIDGATGTVLWTVPAHNQVVGTAVFQDINQDGTDDVFIGGRSAIFFAIDGKSGTKIWEYASFNDTISYVDDTTMLNFFNPQLIPDIDNDGFQDLLAPFGGFVKAQHGDPNRPAGSLILLSGKTGKTIASAIMPDGKETYMTPLCYDFGQGQEIIFGTGGEDISGKLYRVAFSDFLKNDLTSAAIILDGGDKGFIAPPLLADVNLDGIRDIIISTVDGRLVCLDGKTNRQLWLAVPGGDFDTYTMPAPGFFTGDDEVPDFFASFGKGAWPDTDYTLHILVDGKTGNIVFKDTLGTFQYASPLVADFTNDGKHDVLLAINHKTSQDVLGDPTDFYANGLFVYAGGQGEVRQAFQSALGSNLGSTPLLTDLDGDRRLDIITAYMGDARNFYSFKNLVIERREIKVNPASVYWGSYLGDETKGISRD